MRISRIELGLKMAELFSLRSECGRGQVGCVITKEGRVVSSGYNNPVKGDHKCKAVCDTEKTCEHSIHAEANAIVWAARIGTSLEGTTMFCTTSPCLKCAQLIAQSGIKELYFQNRYRDDTGILYLQRMQINVYQNTEDGITVA